MRCLRCQGWMVNEKYYGAGLTFRGWRCISCGEILDPVIWKNRNHRPEPPLVESQGTSAERRGQGEDDDQRPKKRMDYQLCG